MCFINLIGQTSSVGIIKNNGMNIHDFTKNVFNNSTIKSKLTFLTTNNLKYLYYYSLFDTLNNLKITAAEQVHMTNCINITNNILKKCHNVIDSIFMIYKSKNLIDQNISDIILHD